MTNEKILKKAIEKAVKNGWEEGKWWLKEFNDIDNINQIPLAEIYFLLFKHDFVKAFWKNEKRRMYLVDGNERNATIDGGEAWKSHLQQMVLKEDKIKYLEKFL